MSGQVLSSDAIAALVDAAKEGRLPYEPRPATRRRRMRPVDFSRPTKFTADQERPWATWVKGDKPITANHLWRLLRKYRVVSEDTYADGAHAKGYKRARFAEVWQRYLVPKNTFPAT